MAKQSFCEVCGRDTTRDAGRCTNGRCATCHCRYCTPGGATEPGHGRGRVPYVCDVFIATSTDPKRCHICLQPKDAHRPPYD